MAVQSDISINHPHIPRPTPQHIGTLGYASLGTTKVHTSRGAVVLMEIGGMIGGCVVVGIAVASAEQSDGLLELIWAGFYIFMPAFNIQSVFLFLMIMAGAYMVGVAAGGQWALLSGFTIRRWFSVILGSAFAWSVAMAVLLLGHFDLSAGELCLSLFACAGLGGFGGALPLIWIRAFEAIPRWPIVVLPAVALVAILCVLGPRNIVADGAHFLAAFLLEFAAVCMAVYASALWRSRSRRLLA